MPYNPGIQDISGQLLAQGMQARAQGIGAGVTTLFQGLQQNQMMTNQAIARFQAASAANPKLLDFLNKAGTEESPVPVNPDVLKAYADIKSGKTNVQNTALLAQFADSYNQAEMAQQQQQMRQAQTALVTAQTNELRNRIARERAVAQMLGFPTGEPSPESVDVELAPVPTGVSAPSRAPTVAPEAIAAPQKTPGAPAPRTPVEAPPSVKAAIRGLEAFTPDIAEQAQREAALKFLSSGQYSDPTTIAQRLAAEKRKQASEERQMTLDEAKQQQEAFNESQKGLPPGQRRAATVKESGTGGYYVLNIGLAELTPLEKKQLEADTKQEEFRLARVNDRIKADIAAAQADRLIAPAVSNLESIIREGSLDEGALATVKANIMNFGKALNFPVDERKLSDTQQALAYFGQIVLPTFAATKGSISDKETELFRSWNPQLGLSNKANLELLGVLQKRINLNREMESLANKVDAQEISEKDYMARRNKLIKAYDDSIPSANELRERSGVRDQPIAQGLGIGAGGEPAPAQQPVTNASSMFNALMQKAKKGQTP